MVVVYGPRRTVRVFGRNSQAAYDLAASLMAKGVEVWVLTQRAAHLAELA